MKNKGAVQQFISTQERDGKAGLLLSGAWTIHHAAAIETQIRRLLQQGRGTEDAPLLIGGIEDIDTAGAWLIRKYFPQNPVSGDATIQQKAILDFLPAGLEALPEKESPRNVPAFFIALGKGMLQCGQFGYEVFIFIGRIFLRFLINFRHPRHFRFPSIVRHIHETGIQAIPIIALLAALMSMVISYQAAIQLQRFGADIFTIDLSVISILREMGVLITAIMVAGRSGSAFAAEIGVMKLREEVDALQTIGLDPIEVLVLPRLIALLFVLPLLTFIADIVGLAGSGIMASVLLDIPFHQFLGRAQGVATPTLFFVGMIKAPVFAFLIAIIGTYQGMNVSGSAESVGRLTTVAVVQSIFLVIMADAFFSIVFSKAGM